MQLGNDTNMEVTSVSPAFVGDPRRLTVAVATIAAYRGGEVSRNNTSRLVAPPIPSANQPLTVSPDGSFVVVADTT